MVIGLKTVLLCGLIDLHSMTNLALAWGKHFVILNQLLTYKLEVIRDKLLISKQLLVISGLFQVFVTNQDLITNTAGQESSKMEDILLMDLRIPC